MDDNNNNSDNSIFKTPPSQLSNSNDTTPIKKTSSLDFSKSASKIIKKSSQQVKVNKPTRINPIHIPKPKQKMKEYRVNLQKDDPLNLIEKQKPLQIVEKIPFYKKLKTGIKQYNPMPKTQEFKPPPAQAGVSGTPLTTQPYIPKSGPTEKKSKIPTPLKITALFIIILILALLIIAYTLSYTNYQIYSPPQVLRDLIDSIISTFNLPTPSN